MEHLSQVKNLQKISQKLYSTELSRFLYENMVWQGITFQTSDIEERFKTNFQKDNNSYYGVKEIAREWWILLYK